LLFDLGIGDIFTVRVAGNVCNEDEMGSIDYAVEHLHAPLCIIMGHQECGAVKAVVEGAKLEGGLAHLVTHIREAVEATHSRSPELKGKEFLSAAVKNNVFESLETLLKGSPVVRDHVRLGKLKVIGAVYDIHTGRIQWLGPHPFESEMLHE
jgi:carbonic anhydrase